jgi:uncharacterized membrane protein
MLLLLLLLLLMVLLPLISMHTACFSAQCQCCCWPSHSAHCKLYINSIVHLHGTLQRQILGSILLTRWSIASPVLMFKCVHCPFMHPQHQQDEEEEEEEVEVEVYKRVRRHSIAY